MHRLHNLMCTLHFNPCTTCASEMRLFVQAGEQVESLRSEAYGMRLAKEVHEPGIAREGRYARYRAIVPF
jgi:hypothetical protein